MDSIINEANFTGLVEEVSESSILVRVNEDEEEIRSSDIISVSLDVEIEESTRDFNLGDEVRVYYDGMIAESYPAQVNNVYAIILEQSGESKTIVEDFKMIKDSFMDYEFQLDETSDSFLLVGKFDLNNDGAEDHIQLVLQKNTDRQIETFIEVNNIRQEIYMSFTMDGEVRLIDLDKNDDFIEIAYFDEGPSADPEYHIYRYDNVQLYKIGSLDDRALVNGQGKMIPSLYYSNFQPVFYSAWLEVMNKGFGTLENNNLEEYLNREYTFNPKETNIFFTPMDALPEDFYPEWRDSYDLEASKLKLIDIYHPEYDNNILNFYLVELESGEKGLLYYWLGD